MNDDIKVILNTGLVQRELLDSEKRLTLIFSSLLPNPCLHWTLFTLLSWFLLRDILKWSCHCFLGWQIWTQKHSQLKSVNVPILQGKKKDKYYINHIIKIQLQYVRDQYKFNQILNIISKVSSTTTKKKSVPRWFYII